MGQEDDDYYFYSSGNDADVDSSGFEDYEETTVDPGYWLLLATCVFCFGFMLVVVPCLLYLCQPHRTPAKLLVDDDDDLKTSETTTSGFATFSKVLAFDKETRKILKLAIPYTVSALATSVFSNTCLILVSVFIGTKQVAAYALVQVLAGLSDGILQAPIYACTTLCSQAVGAGNNVLAGNYIQLSLTLYILFQVPVVIFWWFYMYEAILFLEWGDEEIALAAQDFVRVYIFSYTFGGISGAVWQLLEVTGHAAEGTVINILWGGTNVLIIGSMVRTRDTTSLAEVAWAFNGTAVFYIGVTLLVASYRGWLKPFWGGLVGSLALKDVSIIRLMLKQAVPLAAGSFLSNAEWAVLTLLASVLGPAEVAAWAILGSIWDVFYSVTAGIGDAAEIRVAFHLGNGSGMGAKISAYKSLFLGMVVASVVSIFYFSMQSNIPAWFTTDETLQKMLMELVPFVGVANLTMTFGMQCWSLVGAQGKYKLATWISFFSSWGVCMPLAAFYVHVLRIDLQGLTSAVVLGYLSTGSALSYVLLSTDWRRQANKIQSQNSDMAMGNESNEENTEEQAYAALRVSSSPAKAAARRNIRLLTLPAGQRSGLRFGNLKNRHGVYVLEVRTESPVKDIVSVGDAILSIDGVAVTQEEPVKISSRLEEAVEVDRHLTVMAPPADVDDIPFIADSCMCWEDVGATYEDGDAMGEAPYKELSTGDERPGQIVDGRFDPYGRIEKSTDAVECEGATYQVLSENPEAPGAQPTTHSAPCHAPVNSPGDIAVPPSQDHGNDSTKQMAKSPNEDATENVGSEYQALVEKSESINADGINPSDSDSAEMVGSEYRALVEKPETTQEQVLIQPCGSHHSLEQAPDVEPPVAQNLSADMSAVSNAQGQDTVEGTSKKVGEQPDEPCDPPGKSPPATVSHKSHAPNEGVGTNVPDASDGVDAGGVSAFEIV